MKVYTVNMLPTNASLTQNVFETKEQADLRAEALRVCLFPEDWQVVVSEQEVQSFDVDGPVGKGWLDIVEKYK